MSSEAYACLDRRDRAGADGIVSSWYGMERRGCNSGRRGWAWRRRRGSRRLASSAGNGSGEDRIEESRRWDSEDAIDRLSATG